MSVRASAVLVALVLACVPARAGVVLNEIFYHAPDDLDDLQFIELHNASDQAVDLAVWKLSEAVKYTFPAKATIAANGYLVLCKNLKEFKRVYGFDAAGQFEGTLSHGSGQIELHNAPGKKVDSVKYRSRA